MKTNLYKNKTITLLMQHEVNQHCLFESIETRNFLLIFKKFTDYSGTCVT